MLVELLSLEVLPAEEEDAVLPLLADPALVSRHLDPPSGCILDEVSILRLSLVEY